MARKKSIYVVLFQGIPEKAFRSKGKLKVYLKQQGTSLTEVQREMDQGEITKLEVHNLELE